MKDQKEIYVHGFIVSKIGHQYAEGFGLTGLSILKERSD